MLASIIDQPPSARLRKISQTLMNDILLVPIYLSTTCDEWNSYCVPILKPFAPAVPDCKFP